MGKEMIPEKGKGGKTGEDIKPQKPLVTKRKRRPIVKFPLAATKRVFDGCGAEQISAEAIEEMNNILFGQGVALARKAAKIAIHSGRKTVKADDIKLALEN